MSSSDSEYESAHEDLDDVLSTPDINSQESIQKSLDEAEELKQEGNDHFRAKRWNEALVAYQTAIGRLPKRRVPRRTANADDRKGKGRDTEESADEGEKLELDQDLEGHGSTDSATDERPLSKECAKARSVLYSNVGACFVKLDDHKAVVEACTEALHDDPTYIKAIQRRAASNDKLDSWSSLTSVQEDYNTLMTLLPPSSAQVAEIQRNLQLLKPRIETAQKRETGEMMDQLKGLGNSLLGNFGLSTDNFQFTPNGQGGYSMNFVR